MRSKILATLGALALLGSASCSPAPTITDATLGFTIVEGLLLLDSSRPTIGTVVLAGTGGTCILLQKGYSFTQIASSDFLTFYLESVGPNLGFLPLTAGTYAVQIPSDTGATSAGMYAAANEWETDGACNEIPTGANSGSVTIEPFSLDAGESSSVNYTVVFGTARFTGAYGLTTCIQPAGTQAVDAGSCTPPP